MAQRSCSKVRRRGCGGVRHLDGVSEIRSAGYADVRPFSDEYFSHHWFRKELAGGV